MRTPRNFGLRPVDEQRWMQENTWCDVCGEADLGMINPVEYGEGDRVYVGGSCRRCGAEVRSEVVEKIAGRPQ